MLAPIVMFVYKRAEHTRKVLEALHKNPLAKDSILYIYADGPKSDADNVTIENINKTRDILKSKQWCKEVHIIEAESNKGLTKSIREGITDIQDKYGKAIILEDDIVTAPCFLTYMNEALNLYEKEEKVMTISGFVPYTTGAEKLPDTYFLRFMSCWGWATWKRAWDKYIPDLELLNKKIPARADFNHFNFDGAEDFYGILEGTYKGTIDTWDIQWVATIFLENGLCLFPKKSVTQNIGFDGSGEHCAIGDSSYKPPMADHVDLYPIKHVESKLAYNYLKRFYRFGTDSSLKRRLIPGIKRTALYKIYSKIRYK